VEVPTPLPVVEIVARFSNRIPRFPLPVPEAIPVALIVPVEVVRVDPASLIWIPLFPEPEAVPLRVSVPEVEETIAPDRISIPFLLFAPFAPVPLIDIFPDPDVKRAVDPVTETP
jgi:hypothetical protein